MTPEQQKAVALARAKAKARARGTGKTYTQGESFSEGIGSGVNLGARDEAEGGQAVRRALGGGFLDDLARSVPFGEIPLRVLDAAGGFAQEFAPGKLGGQVQKIYEAPRDERRTIQQVAQIDNPLSYLGGDVLGSSVTLAPLGTLGVARSTATVGAEKTAKAADLMRKAAAATDATKKAALTAKATNLAAQGSKLAKPATTAGDMGTRIARLTGETAFRSGRAGAGFGAGLGFTNAQGELEDRFAAAGDGAVAGGIGGAIIGPLALGLAPLVGGIAYKITTPKEVKGLDMVIKRMQRSGTTPEGIRAQFDLWNKTGEVPETLAEFMGPNERSLLSALITVNRETREQATNIFVGRGKEEVNRLEDAFSKSFGAGRGDYQKTKVAAQEARAKEAEPFYEGAYVDAATGQRKFLGQPETDALVYEVGGSRVAQSTLSTASDYADALGKRAIRDEIDDFAKAMRAGKPVKPLSVEAADYIERGINRRYNAATKGEAQDIPAGLRGLRDRVRGIIDASGLGQARATAAEAIRRGELLDEGLGIMSPTVDVDDVNRVMQGIPDAGIPAASDAGRTAYGVGASRAVANALRNVPDMAGFADATRKVARTPALREKLEAARPKVLTKSGAENKGSRQTKANAALDTAIERASDRAQFGVDMVGNSKTAFRQGDVTDAVMDDAMSQQAGEMIGDLLISGVGGVTQRLQDRAGRFIGNRIGQPSIYRPQVNRAAAEVLLATGDQIPVQIARIAKRAAERANGRSRALPIAPPAGAAPAAAPVPPPKPLGKLGTRTADAAAIATLGLQGGTAEADTGGASAELQTANERVNTATKRIETADNELARLREEVLLLERVAAEEPPVPLVPTAEGKRVQRILAARNFDLGPNGVDGRVGGDTRKALAGNIAAIKSDIAKTEAEREDALKEAGDARNAEKQAQYLQMQRDAEPSGSQGLLVGGAALGAAIAGAMLAKGGRFRGVNFGRYGSLIKSDAKAAATTRKVNKLINTGKLTSAQSGANSINQRAANVNTIAQIGGAGRRVPFEEDAAGVLKERSRKNMLGSTVRPMETSELFKPQRFNSNDAYAFGVAGLDVAITEGGIRHLKSEIKAAEAEMERAKNADDRQAFYAALKEKQSNEGLLVFAQIAQKVGMGYIGGRAISGIKPYSAPTPDLAGIRAERTLILQAINKPPPKPRKPAGTKPNP